MSLQIVQIEDNPLTFKNVNLNKKYELIIRHSKFLIFKFF